MNSEMFNKGLSKRRKVLGDEYVDKALATADEFGADLQKLITEYAWGEVWNKEALSDKERSMINLGMISAFEKDKMLQNQRLDYFLFSQQHNLLEIQNIRHYMLCL